MHLNSEFAPNDLFINNLCRLVKVNEVEITAFHNIKNFSIVVINIHSLHANFEKLLFFLSLIKIPLSLIVLGETWLDQNIDKLYNINGYYHKSIHRNRHGDR